MFLDRLDAGFTSFVFFFSRNVKIVDLDSQVYDSVLVKWKFMLSTLHYLYNMK